MPNTKCEECVSILSYNLTTILVRYTVLIIRTRAFWDLPGLGFILAFINDNWMTLGKLLLYIISLQLHKNLLK